MTEQTSIVQEIAQRIRKTDIVCKLISSMEACVRREFPDSDENTVKAFILEILYTYDILYTLAYNIARDDIISQCWDDYMIISNDNYNGVIDLLIGELYLKTPEYLEILDIVKYEMLVNDDIRDKIMNFNYRLPGTNAAALELLNSLIGG